LLQQGETANGRGALTACLEIWRRQGDLSRVAIELSSLGVALWTAGDLEAGRAPEWDQRRHVGRARSAEAALADALGAARAARDISRAARR
jgi:hypothetical protein